MKFFQLSLVCFRNFCRGLKIDEKFSTSISSNHPNEKRGTFFLSLLPSFCIFLSSFVFLLFSLSFHLSGDKRIFYSRFRISLECSHAFPSTNFSNPFSFYILLPLLSMNLQTSENHEDEKEFIVGRIVNETGDRRRGKNNPESAFETLFRKETFGRLLPHSSTEVINDAERKNGRNKGWDEDESDDLESEHFNSHNKPPPLEVKNSHIFLAYLFSLALSLCSSLSLSIYVPLPLSFYVPLSSHFCHGMKEFNT